MQLQKWWEQTVCYQIYVPSFHDTTGNGIGDLQGVIQQLPYLQSIGVGAIWLTPFYPSPRVDNGYDVADYCAVDPLYGTLEDFDLLVQTAEQLNIKVIIDLVLNHTSNKHQWFQEARKSKDNPYYDYYIWEDTHQNNWESYFTGDAWKLNAATNTYYYHAFAKEQVDLNWTNPRVLEEFQSIFDFWLARGVAGFRLDVINFLTTDRTHMLKDNPYDKNGVQLHQNDQNYPGIYPMLQKVSSYIKEQKADTFLIGEVGSEDITVLAEYGKHSGLDVIFNFNLGSISAFTVESYIAELQKTYELYDEKMLPTLFFSSHDMRRGITRLAKNDPTTAKQLTALQLLLKGVPFIYQGEEFYQQDVVIASLAAIHDIQGRQAYTSALQKGHSEAEALQEAFQKTRDYSRALLTWEQKDTDFFAKLTALRNVHASLQSGQIAAISVTESVLSFERSNEQEQLGIVLNFGTKDATLAIAKDAILLAENYTHNTLAPKGIIIYKKMK